MRGFDGGEPGSVRTVPVPALTADLGFALIAAVALGLAGCGGDIAAGGERDAGETDVAADGEADTGQPDVGTDPQPDVTECTIDADCALGQICAVGLGTCVEAEPCSDRVRNGGESDVDCGGPDCHPCAVGRACGTAADCQAGSVCDADVRVCLDVDECVDGTAECDPNARCDNLTLDAGGFACTCNSGYGGDGLTCADLDECAEGTAGCSPDATCTNTDGAFTCSCNPPLIGDGVTCTLPTDCSANPGACGANATCTPQADGTDVCECDAGYVGDGLACADVDECDARTDDCDAHATCTNAPGSFSCACDAGFTGNGRTCTDIDECAAGTDDCGDDATCSNAPGSFSCACSAGYSGDGHTCTDIDECALGTDNCHPDSVCANTDGGFTCTCNAGFDCEWPASCRAIVLADPAAADGVYTIDAGAGGVDVFCDMTTDGGVGYTLLRVDDPSLGTGRGSQGAYAAACAALGLEIIVPRTKSHARAIQAYNGDNPNLVNVFPDFDGASGLSNWTGQCQGEPCSFYLDDSDSAGCVNPEPNGDNDTAHRIYRRSNAGGCFFGNWNDDNDQVAVGGYVVCSTNDAAPPTPVSCEEAHTNEWLINVGPRGVSGPYPLDPDGDDVTDPVYCDMSTDEGGWTLVSSSTAPVDDAADAHAPSLATLAPGAAMSGVWDGMRAVVGDSSDIRFACKTNLPGPMAVDLSFYDVEMYGAITTGTDADSCSRTYGQPLEDATFDRRDNLTDTLLTSADHYDGDSGTNLIFEDSCGDSGDFTVDFDDHGMDSDESDGTDWGEDDDDPKCGANGAGAAWFVFVR